MTVERFEKDFVLHTLHILENYDGPYGVTLLINCMLGLIVLPRERGYNRISERDGITFQDLGLNESDVLCWGNLSAKEHNAARFIRCLRNSVAHIQIDGLCEKGEIKSLRFADESGFKAVLSIDKIKEMTYRLADYIH